MMEKLGDKMILLVEDEEFLRELYEQILRDEGYKVDVASDGDMALAKMKKGGYDLVLLDIMLPRISGIDILKRLADEPPEFPNKKVVLLTNLNQDSIIAQGVALGIRGYMVKSDYTPDQILNEVHTYLLEDSN